MIIYSYQSENLVNKIKADGIATVEFSETNLYRHTQNSRNGQLFEAYMWMWKPRRMTMATILMKREESSRYYHFGDGI